MTRRAYLPPESRARSIGGTAESKARFEAEVNKLKAAQKETEERARAAFKARSEELRTRGFDEARSKAEAKVRLEEAKASKEAEQRRSAAAKAQAEEIRARKEAHLEQVRAKFNDPSETRRR